MKIKNIKVRLVDNTTLASS